ncbi:phosphotransferase [Marinospirillum alkaliphilum]|uniref:PhoU domain-containing protein n=1 Tax=Marinospirillum alkaliphilum DSM 21637 TaxID=1122209 RepID=A0A1K1WL09_9GAMM|nr:phosphotransferase [Marinospirillum alkaliphilum]SFX37811.1 PhoU domain-containing protein [Marinospirillum alkaliphilum DSM 21637]
MQLLLADAVRHPLLLLLAEVRTQLQELQRLLEKPGAALAQGLLRRRGQPHQLAHRVQQRALEQLHASTDGHLLPSVRAAGDTADELERIATLCREAAREALQLEGQRLQRPQRYIKRLQQVDQTLQQLEQLISTPDAHEILRISRVQRKLTRFYQRVRKAHLKALKQQENPELLIISLFLARHIHEMGQALVSICESLISVLLGQPMSPAQLRSLKSMMTQLGVEPDWQGLSLAPLAETRSGNSIAALASEAGTGSMIGVLKEGELHKVKEEKRGLRQWNSLFPGIAPQILSHHDQGDSASLIIEHLPGLTFERLLLQEDAPALQAGMTHLLALLPQVWEATLQSRPISGQYMRQLGKRLPSVYNVHPEFRRWQQQAMTLADLLQAAGQLEQKAPAPFSVYIHGDFNLDNLLYDAREEKVRFIDLHRSRQMDYVQDVSVFMVSCLRLPLFESESRQRARQTAWQMFDMAQAFASAHQDDGFELRMTLGLGRSLITSTRYLLDRAHARELFEQGCRLLLALHQQKPNKPLQIHLKEWLHG